jgi:hypothetical protein
MNSEKFCDAHIPNTNDFTVCAKVVNKRFSARREENMLTEEAHAKIYVTLKASQKKSLAWHLWQTWMFASSA